MGFKCMGEGKNEDFSHPCDSCLVTTSALNTNGVPRKLFISGGQCEVWELGGRRSDFDR